MYYFSYFTEKVSSNILSNILVILVNTILKYCISICYNLHILNVLHFWHGKYLHDCVAVSFHLSQSSALVQTSEAIPTYATWINSTFTKSASHTKLAACQQGVWSWILTSFFAFNWSISKVLLHIRFFLAFVKTSIGHHPCSSCTSTKEHTLGFSHGLGVNYYCCHFCVGVRICTVHTGSGQKTNK